MGGTDLGARHDSLDQVQVLMEQNGMPAGKLSKVKDPQFPIERLVFADKPDYFLASQRPGQQALVPPTVRRYLALEGTFANFQPEGLTRDTRMRLCEFFVGMDLDIDPDLNMDDFFGGYHSDNDDDF